MITFLCSDINDINAHGGPQNRESILILIIRLYRLSTAIIDYYDRYYEYKH